MFSPSSKSNHYFHRGESGADSPPMSSGEVSGRTSEDERRVCVNFLVESITSEYDLLTKLSTFQHFNIGTGELIMKNDNICKAFSIAGSAICGVAIAASFVPVVICPPLSTIAAFAIPVSAGLCVSWALVAGAMIGGVVGERVVYPVRVAKSVRSARLAPI